MHFNKDRKIQMIALKCYEYQLQPEGSYLGRVRFQFSATATRDISVQPGEAEEIHVHDEGTFDATYLLESHAHVIAK